MVQYNTFYGSLVPESLVSECAALYSGHYGTWSHASRIKPGSKIRLSPERLRDWIISPDSNITVARDGAELIGYAIAIRTKVPKWGIVSWVSQLVVHEGYRHSNVAKTLLFSTWGFSNHFAWGLVTANPYAVRALEKATRRRCVPKRIKANVAKLITVGSAHVPYINSETKVDVSTEHARVNTQFFLDHSQVEEMIQKVVSNEKPWLLGELEEGWEWLAFTFHDQMQISLTNDEIDAMLAAADDVTREAYSRMSLGASHAWAKHGDAEAEFIARNCGLSGGSTVLDLGCGSGRHVHSLARQGMRAVGIDYVEPLIQLAIQSTDPSSLGSATFTMGDCRTIELGSEFDAVICLYDVVGTYAENENNLDILRNVARHLRHGGYALISVMNMEATRALGPEEFSLKDGPDRLLELPASNTMEKSGDVFKPEFMLIDRDTEVVYRKEQFSMGAGLPVELIVRDRRFTKRAIAELCQEAGLNVIWSRYVRAGAWEEEASAEKAKEILVLCQRPEKNEVAQTSLWG